MVRVKEVSCGVKQGSVFGRWTVIGKPFGVPGKHDYRWLVVCQCECGKTDVVHIANLITGASRGCRPCGHIKHGNHAKRLHNIWRHMKQRCYDPTRPQFKDYGARGIEICDEWRESFEAFEAWSLQNGYTDDLQIDRRNNDGNYEPGNCRWVTGLVNSSNKRNTRFITAFGETKHLFEWSRDSRCKVTVTTLHMRLKSNWEPEKAITTKSRQDKKPCTAT